MGKLMFTLLLIIILFIPVILLACMYVIKRFWTNKDSLNMTMRKIRELNKKLRNKSKTVLKNIVDNSFSERRSGLRDRRSDLRDRRCGMADRRKKIRA